jgi:DNA-binding response OmpR family regulator
LSSPRCASSPSPLARPEDRADALLAGCDSYVENPFNTDALAERLRVALGIVGDLAPIARRG